MAAARDGTNIEISGSTSASQPIRALVRSFSQAKAAPIRTAIAPPQSTRMAVLSSAPSVSLLVTTSHGESAVWPGRARGRTGRRRACTSG